jgi:hypothetical protein
MTDPRDDFEPGPGDAARPRTDDPQTAEPIDAQFEPATDFSAKRGGPGWAGLAAASILAAVTGGAIAMIGDRFNTSAPASLARDVKTLRTEREQLSLEVAALADEQAALKTAMGGADLTALLGELDRASRRLDEALISGTGPKSLSALDARLAAIEAADTKGPATNRDVSRALASLAARIDAAETALANARNDARAIDTLAVRLTQAEATLEMLRTTPGGTARSDLESGRVVSDLRAEEARARDAARRSADTTSAALALASIERAAQRGASFESDYRALRALRPASEPVRALGAVAPLGAPLASELKSGFVKAERVARRALPEEADRGLGWLKSLFGDAVRVRTKDGADSSIEALEAARAAVAAENFEGALAALTPLTGDAGAAMADWRAGAERRVALDNALADLRADLTAEERP